MNPNTEKTLISKIVSSRLCKVTIIINLVVLLVIVNSISNVVYILQTQHSMEIVDNVSSSIETTMSKYILLCDVLAKTTSIIDIVSAGNKEVPMHMQDTADDVIRQLSILAKEFEGIICTFGILSVAQDGYLIEDGSYSDEDFSFKERPYFNVVTDAEVKVTLPYKDVLSDNIVISIGAPIFDGDTVVGAVVLDLYLEFVSDIIAESNNAETGKGMVLDEVYTLIAHSDQELLGTDLSENISYSENIITELFMPSDKLVIFTENEENRIGYVGLIPEYNWKVLTYMDLDEFNSHTNNILLNLSFILVISIIITILTATFTVKKSLKPITEIKIAMQELAEGNTSYKLAYKSKNEIGDLADNVRFASEMLSDYIAQIEYQLDIDELTLLYTERKFIKEVENALITDTANTYTILSLDIDNFKYINDTHNYQVGSEVLKELAIQLRILIGDNTIISRVHSDNFLILLKQEQSNIIANSSRDYAPFQKKVACVVDEHYDLSMSIGLYSITNKSLDIPSMIDCAVYARNKGKSVAGFSVNTYNDDMHAQRTSNNYIVSKMRDAEINNEFVIYYQPKFDLVTNEIKGAEALVRWFHDGSMISPGDFISIFENNGFIEKLDYYVMRATCKFIKDNQDKDLPIISVNLSGVTMMKPDIVQNILDIVKEHGLCTSRIELEITESAFVNQFEEVVERINDFRQEGFRISMDDFGCGVSSLGRLKDMPIDVLKIDREFIIDSPQKANADKILKNIVNMAKDLELKIVIEGIETPSQLELMRDLGCDLGQGFIFSRPLPENEFLEKLTNQVLN